VRQDLPRPFPTSRADVSDSDDLELVRMAEVGRGMAFLGDKSETDLGTLQWTGHASALAVK
jgi:hypothetical protein